MAWLARPLAPEACGLEYRSFGHAFITIARCEGLPGLYRGLLPSLLLVRGCFGECGWGMARPRRHNYHSLRARQVSHGAIQFAVYEELKTLAQSGLGAFTSPLTSSSSGGGGLPPGQRQQQRELGSLDITACGALSKLVASTATYPSQVIRSRLQQRMDARAVRYRGVLDALRTTLAREGLGGLYKGLVPNVLRVMPQSALTFLLYESTMRALSAGGRPL